MAQEIKYFKLVNKKGESVVLSNFGAGIIEINVADRAGKIDNVSLAYARKEDYFDDGPYLGKTPGRYSNRIARGRFTLDGIDYQLSINCGEDHLHGGKGTDSYANRIWDAEQVGNKVTFTLFSPDGDANYPGNVNVKAVYTWTDDSCLTLDLFAETDRRTIVNLTNHVYFDLRGAHNKAPFGITKHILMLNCSKYLPTGPDLIPVGRMDPVEGTPMDFRVPKEIGRDLHADFPAIHHGKGYDACFVMDDCDGDVKPIAEACEPETGRKMTLSTNKPGVQLYTGNWLSGCPDGPEGYVYKDYDGFALECQDFPDAPNQPSFGYKPLEPGELYHNVLKWQFGTF